jgi:hypothetical protein
MKYSIEVSNDDLRNLRDVGFLPINNTFCLIQNEEEGIDVSPWPGAGGTYFTENPELDNATSGDTVEVLLPNGIVKSFELPYHI